MCHAGGRRLTAPAHTGVPVTERGTFVTTASRGRFYLLDPRPEDVHIADIAAGLSKQCRYNGQCDRFYSVAEHSVLASMLTDAPTLAAWMLMHDAAEAYVGDMVAPLKAVLPAFVAIEARILQAIATRFGLPEMPEAVHDLDALMCATEKRDLIGGAEPWPGTPSPIDELEIPEREVGPREAELMFMRRFRDLFPSA